MVNIKSIVGVVAGIAVVGGGLNFIAKEGNKEKFEQIHDSYNLTSSEVKQIDKSIAEKTSKSFFKTFDTDGLLRDKIRSLDAEKQSLSIAANRKILTVKPSELTYEAGKQFVRDSLAAVQQKIKIIK